MPKCREKQSPLGLNELIILAMESMAVAVSIIDSKGTLLYYNKEASRILDRKPEYIGTDAHTHHKKTASNQKFDGMLDAFRKGRTAPFHYHARPYGRPIMVTLAPIFKDDRFIGCTQSVRLKEGLELE